MRDGPVPPEEWTEMPVLGRQRPWHLVFFVVPGALYAAVPAVPF
jgi:hypothetical protein